MAGFFSFSLIRWTRNSEHANFAPSVAGIPPDLNTDLTLSPATVEFFRSQVKKHFAFNPVENRTILAANKSY